MAQSMNTRVDLTIKATSLRGLTEQGDVMLGDKAFEFYNERNVEDYIQIPWCEIDKVAASVIFRSHIARFAVMTKQNGTYTFSTRDNKRTLRAMRAYLSDDQLVRSLSFFDVISRGIKGLFRRV